jgi:hypothetical protein
LSLTARPGCARMFVPVEPFQLGLVFDGKDRNLAQKGSPSRPSLQMLHGQSMMPHIWQEISKFTWWVQQKNAFSAMSFSGLLRGRGGSQ